MKKLIVVILLIGMIFIGYELVRGVDSVFPKQEEAFGVKIYGTKSVSDEKMKHAKAILSEYLDNDEDGFPDNPKVVEVLRKEKASIMIAKNQMDSMKILLLNRGVGHITSKSQELYASEIHINDGEFDGSLEEILHVITHVGYAGAYPEVFGEKTGTDISKLMDIARGGQFIQVPKKYPETAWYTYYDKTADYGTMVTEYFYWALTSILGGQDFEGRYERIAGEWRLNTKEKVMASDPGIYKLLTDTEYKLPTKLPDGKY
ncbi:hypothetical protein EZV73_03140 [Acidaminobacter sp. JC074]|uniref:hypothetical protein n=1 Tax=Acidaminobacter sp. JC074 TaxID=2530199 RepID=UPI001F0F6E45|nr:hypothetical protein [Acidaminobacter sp. JC074]MCH4886544.1 hypothetical protein [Acidaminobacter sp. JC074]